jgi:lia operon protein LiaG
MKPSLKKFIIWLSVAMVASFAIAAIIMVFTGNFTLNTEEINDSKSFNIEEINEIVIDLTSADINIIPTKEGELIVHLYGKISTNIRKDVPELIAYKTGDKLYIETHNPNEILIGINIRQIDLDVYVPEKDLASLNIEASSSDISINGIKAADLKIKNTSGDIRVEELVSEKIWIDSTSGDIALIEYIGNIDIENTSGRISLLDGETNEDIYIVSISGDVLIEQEQASDMNIKITSGDLKIKLSESAKFNLDARTSSGDINISFPISISSSGRKDLEGKVGESDEIITVKTSSGDIDIDYR